MRHKKGLGPKNTWSEWWGGLWSQREALISRDHNSNDSRIGPSIVIVKETTFLPLHPHIGHSLGTEQTRPGVLAVNDHNNNIQSQQLWQEGPLFVYCYWKQQFRRGCRGGKYYNNKGLSTNSKNNKWSESLLSLWLWYQRRACCSFNRTSSVIILILNRNREAILYNLLQDRWLKIELLQRDQGLPVTRATVIVAGQFNYGRRESGIHIIRNTAGNHKRYLGLPFPSFYLNRGRWND